MTRVTMPSRDSLGCVDPDNVQMAEVDTLFIHQGGAGAALGAAAGPPGCTGSRLLTCAIRPGAELGAQDGCGEKQRSAGWSPQRCCLTRLTPDLAEQVKAGEVHNLPSASDTEEKGSLLFSLPNTAHPYPYCLIHLQRLYKRRGTTAWKGPYQPLKPPSRRPARNVGWLWHGI